MKKLISIMLVFTISLASCAGRRANLVPSHQPSDKDMSCAGLQVAVSHIDAQIGVKEDAVDSKFTYNVIMFVAGFLVIVPWFFMDFKGAEEKEIDALQNRRARLLTLAADEDCN